MQKPLEIESTRTTPKIDFNNETGILQISGRSLPEDVIKFYTEVRDWVLEYIETPLYKTEIIFDLDYFNSSTARVLVKILVELESISKEGKVVKVIWKYKEKDEVMLERGEEIKNVVFLQFELLAY